MAETTDNNELVAAEIAEAQNAIALKDALIRLRATPDFKMVIDNALVASTLIQQPKELLSSDKSIRRYATDKLKLVGLFQQFLGAILQEGEKAVVELEELERQES